MCNVMTSILPVLVGALSTLKKEFTKNLHKLPDHHTALEVQNIALMGTAHNPHEVLG